MGAIDGLRLDCRIPPGIEDEDVVGRRQVEAQAAGLEADQEERTVGVGLEALDTGGAIPRRAVEVLVSERLRRRLVPKSWLDTSSASRDLQLESSANGFGEPLERTEFDVRRVILDSRDR